MLAHRLRRWPNIAERGEPRYTIYYLRALHLIRRRGEAGKGGQWSKGAINDILIVTCCMKY